MTENLDRIRSDYVFSHNVDMQEEYKLVKRASIRFTGLPAANDRIELALPIKHISQNGYSTSAVTFRLNFSSSGTNGTASASYNFNALIGANIKTTIDNLVAIINGHSNHGSETGFMGNAISAKHSFVSTTITIGAASGNTLGTDTADFTNEQFSVSDGTNTITYTYVENCNNSNHKCAQKYKIKTGDGRTAGASATEIADKLNATGLKLTAKASANTVVLLPTDNNIITVTELNDGNIGNANDFKISTTEDLIMTWKGDRYPQTNSNITLVDASGSDLPVTIKQKWLTDRKHTLHNAVPVRLGLPAAFNLRRQSLGNSPYKVTLGKQSIT